MFNSEHQILLTKRSPEKKFAPNLWENTGGHALSGETGPEAIVRELREETGIEAKPEEMIEIGCTVRPGSLGLEYAVIKDVPIQNVKLQPGETCDVKWVTLNELDRMLQSGEMASSTLAHMAFYREAFERWVR